MGILRIAAFSTKVLVTGGALYCTNIYGIWGSTQQTEEGYARLKLDMHVSTVILKMLLKPKSSRDLPRDCSHGNLI